MKKLLAVIIILAAVTVIAGGCTRDSGRELDKQSEKKETRTPVEITVSAAASLKDAMEEIKPIYEKNHRDIKLILNFGSSGTLQHQIEQGAPVDLFISAGQSQMDSLAEKQLLVKASRVNLFANELVLIVGNDINGVHSFSDLENPAVKYIGIGQPESVPAGKYAKEALTSLKLWETLNPKYVEAKDVRQVLAYVETGAAEAGLVYKSDTIISDRVKIAAVAPADSHKPIVYPAAIIKSSKHTAAAEEFLKFLNSSEAKMVFEKYGFNVVRQEVSRL